METTDLIADIVDRLKTVRGINAVVLGGSRARNAHTESSDIDLGIYYHPSTLMDLSALERVAYEINNEHRENLVTGIGGWGPWINGGGWLKVHGVPVDFIYRDLDKVTHIIDDCCAGQIQTVYQPGHPFGFVSAIYLAEVALCQPLWDPQETIKHAKTRVIPYPPRLKKAIIDSFWWEVGFSFAIAQKSISRGDVTYAAGCCFRGVTCLMQVLFAVNEQYWMNEKGAIALASKFEKSPSHLKERVETAFSQLNQSSSSIASAIQALQDITAECESWVVEQ